MRWPLDSSEHVSFLRTRVGDFTSPEVRKKKTDMALQVKNILLNCGERRKILDLHRNWLRCVTPLQACAAPGNQWAMCRHHRDASLFPGPAILYF